MDTRFYLLLQFIKMGERAYVSNAKGMNSNLSGFSYSKFVKALQCESTKEMWDKLVSIYKGDEKVNNATLETF